MMEGSNTHRRLDSGAVAGGVIGLERQARNECSTADACAEAPRTIRASVEVRAHHDFSTALRALRDGQRVTRAGWNGHGMWLQLQVPDKGSKMTRPYLYMKTVDNDLVPWVASQSDLLASDWAVLPT